MASYHILETTGNNQDFSVVVEYHIAIPSEQNLTSTIDIQTALANDAEIDKTSVVASAAELTAMANGQLLKITEKSDYNSNHNLADHRAKIRARYDALAISGVDYIRRRYRFTNFSETKGVDF